VLVVDGLPEFHVRRRFADCAPIEKRGHVHANARPTAALTPTKVAIGHAILIGDC
jgi:hypothetical protein